MRRTTSWPTSAVATAVLALAVTPVCVPAAAWADGDDPASDARSVSVQRAGAPARPAGDAVGGGDAVGEGDTAEGAGGVPDGELVPDGEPVPEADDTAAEDLGGEEDLPAKEEGTADGDSPSDSWAPDGLDAESAGEGLELTPAEARPGTTVTANTTACGEDRRATGDADSVGAGDFPLEKGTHDGDLVGRFVVPAGARPGTYTTTVSCENGTEERAELRVVEEGGTELHGVHAGDGGSLGGFSTAQLVLGWLLITGSAGTAAYYVRRRHQDGWP
ncbi:hypothetical protein [Streptomyces sp. NPDC049813]|uniref:hypothetical protein n=1 Tax=Streptomyces sp. NPDC049813 TaxID=3365597 RepID=UPI0037A2BE8D